MTYPINSLSLMELEKKIPLKRSPRFYNIEEVYPSSISSANNPPYPIRLVSTNAYQNPNPEKIEEA